MLEQLPVKIAPQQVSSLEAIADEIVVMAKKGAYPKSIYDKLVLDHPGFSGSLSAVKRVWRQWHKARGVQAEDVAIPVDTAPGDVAQVDFGYVGMLVDPDTGKLRKAWVFTLVLGYSRHLFAKIVFDQRADTWVQLHIEAFRALGVERSDEGLNRTYRELVFFLAPLHDNVAKRLIKSPKPYFVDTALLTYLLGLHDPEPTLRGPLGGALMDTVVVAEWRKAHRHRERSRR